MSKCRVIFFVWIFIIPVNSFLRMDHGQNQQTNLEYINIHITEGGRTKRSTDDTFHPETYDLDVPLSKSHLNLHLTRNDNIRTSVPTLSLKGNSMTYVYLEDKIVRKTPSDASWTETVKVTSFTPNRVDSSTALQLFQTWNRNPPFSLPGHDHAMLVGNNCMRTLSVGFDPTGLTPYDQQLAGQVFSADEQCWCKTGVCVSDVNAPAGDENCLYGDRKGAVFNNGWTCEDLARELPSACVNHMTSCCESCAPYTTTSTITPAMTTTEKITTTVQPSTTEEIMTTVQPITTKEITTTPSTKTTSGPTMSTTTTTLGSTTTALSTTTTQSQVNSADLQCAQKRGTGSNMCRKYQVQPTTTEEITTTVQPTTTEEITTTVQPTTTEETVQPTTTEEITNLQQLKKLPLRSNLQQLKKYYNYIQPTTTEEITTTVQPTTTEEITTKVQPTTTEEITTTVQPTTTEEITTSTEEITTTVQPTTTEEITTTVQPTTMEEIATTVNLQQLKSTTVPPTTTEEITTTVPPTTTGERTTNNL
ncbi:unnamed protein product [Mytilus edulis]|uniref:Uncharacterized protein n=1 Tax=Mytilus edulis TaxID=6550 RepID=A0A8S3QVJ0_MYTED|nr:unnamed protein product [Mytilus edulis]